MLRRWRIWGAFGVLFAIVAETLNYLVPDQHFIQFVLFTLAVVCFILAITGWDRQKRSRDAEP